MSTVPVGDSEIFIMSLEQFAVLYEEDRKHVCLIPSPFSDSSLSWAKPTSTLSSARPGRPITSSIRPDPIWSVNPLESLDRANEWLKDNTYVDMFGWKDAVASARSAVKQITLLGIMGDAYIARTRAGKEAVVFKGRPGLRSKLQGTRYLRDHPIVREAGFVIGKKEMLAEAGKATRIAIFCFIGWDIAHELFQDKHDMTRLGVSILSDIFQSVAATYIGVAVGLIATTAGSPIVVSFCFGAVVSFLGGALLSKLDKRYQLTEIATEFSKKEISNTSEFLNHAAREGKDLALSINRTFHYHGVVP